MIKGIVCVDKHWGIGKKNGLLFSLKQDMKHFKLQTQNDIVVMGENTFLSLPKQKPLVNRLNIVLCPKEHNYEGCTCVHEFNQLVALISKLAKDSTVWIIGGGMLYNSMLSYYDEVVVTKVDAVDNEATVFFPNLDELNDFKCIDETEEFEDSGYKIKFATYERIK